MKKLTFLWLLLSNLSMLNGQNTIELKLNPFLWADQIMPTLSFEKIAPDKRTAWEAGLMLNVLSTCTEGTYNNTCQADLYKNYLYAGAYGSWRWYPLAKPGRANWLFIGVMAAYGGGILPSPEVRNFFYLYSRSPSFAYQHHQRQLFLGPLGGIKLIEGKRVSLEGLFFISPYYKRISFSSDIPRYDGSYSINLGYRIYKRRKID